MTLSETLLMPESVAERQSPRRELNRSKASGHVFGEVRRQAACFELIQAIPASWLEALSE